MPRAAKDTKLDTREARSRLKVRKEPYWRSVMPGLFLGYRSNKTGGVWIARVRRGDGYEEGRLGIADDAISGDLDGVVLSYSKATEAAIQFARTAEPPKPPRTVGAGTTVAQAIAAYLKDLGLRRPGTSGVSTARQQADRYILPKLGDRLVASLRTTELTAFVEGVAATRATVRAKGDSKRRERKDYDLSDPATLRSRFETAKRVWTTLRAALVFAWRQQMDGVRDDIEWRRVKLRPPAVEEQPPRMLDDKEVMAVLGACQSLALRNLIEAALHTGARLGEIQNMRVRDFAESSVAIRQTKPINPKTLHQPLTPEGAAFFKRMVEGKLPDDLIFVREDGRAWEKSQHHKGMVATLAAAGVKDASFKTLRATYGKRLLIATGDLEKVRAALGHADQRITRKHYAQFLQGEIAEAVARLPDLAGKRSGNAHSTD